VSFVNRSICLLTRTFVNTLDSLTTPGYLDGPGARERAGLQEEGDAPKNLRYNGEGGGGS
jgi:hypothetical protein